MNPAKKTQPLTISLAEESEEEFESEEEQGLEGPKPGEVSTKFDSLI